MKVNVAWANICSKTMMKHKTREKTITAQLGRGPFKAGPLIADHRIDAYRFTTRETVEERHSDEESTVDQHTMPISVPASTPQVSQNVIQPVDRWNYFSVYYGASTTAIVNFPICLDRKETHLTEDCNQNEFVEDENPHVFTWFKSESCRKILNVYLKPASELALLGESLYFREEPRKSWKTIEQRVLRVSNLESF